MEEINNILKNAECEMKRLHHPYVGSEHLLLAILKSNDILTKYRYKNNQLINALGKPILIGKGENGDIVMPGEKSFDVVYTDLSFAECINVASYQFEQQETLGLLQITIIGPEKSRIFEWSATDYADKSARGKTFLWKQSKSYMDF